MKPIYLKYSVKVDGFIYIFKKTITTFSFALPRPTMFQRAPLMSSFIMFTAILPAFIMQNHLSLCEANVFGYPRTRSPYRVFTIRALVLLMVIPNYHYELKIFVVLLATIKVYPYSIVQL